MDSSAGTQGDGKKGHGDGTLRIVTVPDAGLREPASDVVHFNLVLADVVSRMVRTMHNRGIGIAAPQVGIPARLFVTAAIPGPAKVFCNAEIIDRRGSVWSTEGCLSCPGETVRVRRAKRVRVKGRDMFGKTFKRWFGGTEAIVIQHEIDHTRGTLIVDKGEKV